MKRTYRTGLILGIALSMLLPAYATAHIDLNILSGEGTNTGAVSVASISATSGANISFQLTSPLPNATFTMILDPDPAPAAGIQHFTSSSATYTWNAVPAGSYTGTFHADNGIDEEQLVVMIRVTDTAGGGGTAETITAPTFAAAPTTGASGTPVSFTINPATSSLGDNLQYYFNWGDGSNTGWVTALTQSHTYSPATTISYNVTVQAKCPTHSIYSSTVSTSISVQGNGGGGTSGPLGSKTNPVVLDHPVSASNQNSYGYSPGLGGTGYTVPMSQSVWFKIDPYTTTGKTPDATNKSVLIWLLHYAQSPLPKNNVDYYLIKVNRNTGVESAPLYLGNYQNQYKTAYLADEYYLVEMREEGIRNQGLMAIWWNFVSY